MKRHLIIIFLLIPLRLFAPEFNAIYIAKVEPCKPYEEIFKAICFVESSNDPLAYHLEKNGFASIGIAQIQISRVNDFNRRTGNDYTLEDMYHPEKAKIVFMHYASEYHPDNVEIISRQWNGGNKGMEKESTIKYYLKVKKLLISL